MTGNHVALGGTAGAPARVRFAVFDSDTDPMLQAWARFREPFVGRPQGTRPTRAPVAPLGNAGSIVAVARSTARSGAQRWPGIWRLLASNNRELGRSSLFYDSFDAACAHVRRLQAQCAELEITVVAGPHNASRGWVVWHEGVTVMTCGRWYNSTSTGAASALGALAALPHAIIADDADRSASSGRFGRRHTVPEHALG
ncbi:hypothetical protein [Agromyces humatus]|uniref:hypothetical protein n=1 Tax=Agromyces humatus TaxID=279573 RepID=UPI001E36D57F|nr:hypothetical protein [Agromyces humatus]